MATAHPNFQARDRLSCCSRGNDSRTIQIISSLSHNPTHAQSLASIQSKEFTSASDDQPNLYLDAFMGYQRDQPTDAMSSSHQVFPGKAYLDFPKFRLSLTDTGRGGNKAYESRTLDFCLSRADEIYWALH